MKVIVIDRGLQSKLWGNGYHSIEQIRKKIEISDNCPVCGEKRGEPHLERYYEDGEYYTVSRWENPCGHVDKYPAVIKEAEEIKK